MSLYATTTEQPVTLRLRDPETGELLAVSEEIEEIGGGTWFVSKVELKPDTVPSTEIEVESELGEGARPPPVGAVGERDTATAPQTELRLVDAPSAPGPLVRTTVSGALGGFHAYGEGDGVQKRVSGTASRFVGSDRRCAWVQ